MEKVVRKFKTGKEVYALIKRSFDKNQRIPFLPQIILDVERALLKRETGAKELSAIILDDPILTAKIIKLGNSLHYNSSSVKVKTVTQAIVVLGFGVVRSAILNFSIIQLVKDLQGANNFRSVWKHSLATGILARELSLSIDKDLAEEAFVGGLLHDIGRLIMSQVFSKHFDMVNSLCSNQEMSELEAELEVFLCTHVDIGLYLAKEWSFPKDLINIIEFHETDPFSQLFAMNLPKTTQAVILADQLVNALDDPFIDEASLKIRRLKKRAQKILNVDIDTLSIFLQKLPLKVEQSAQILDHIINDKTKLKKEKQPNQQVDVTPDVKINDLENKLALMTVAADEAYQHSSISLFFEATAKSFAKALNSNLFFILFYSHSAKAIKARLGYGLSANVIQSKLCVSVSEKNNLIVDVYKTNMPIVVTANNLDKYSTISDTSLFSQVLTTNIVAVPITLKSKVVGVLLACRDVKFVNFTKDDIKVITSYSKNITQVLRKGVL